MTVLITNSNKDFFKKHYPRAKFVESTKNTSTFNIGEKAFIKLRDKIRELGFNPYAVMSW